LKRSGVFAYDRTWGTLIGYPPSYGSDTELNDHHFHYGYFVRRRQHSAAVKGSVILAHDVRRATTAIEIDVPRVRNPVIRHFAGSG
jgi:endoglucanase Acf2